jgi:hypothetical protein
MEATNELSLEKERSTSEYPTLNTDEGRFGRRDAHVEKLQ